MQRKPYTRTERFEAQAKVVSPAERDALCRKQASLYSQFADEMMPCRRGSTSGSSRLVAFQVSTRVRSKLLLQELS